MYDLISTLLGILMGMIIMLAIVWVAYAGNFFVFSYCATSTPYCKDSDYINQIDEAIKKGYNKEDILFLKNGELYFKRPKFTRQCVPSKDQIVKIDKPDTCVFTIDNNNYIGRQLFQGSSVYKTMVGGNEYRIKTDDSCNPVDGIAQNGYPSLYNY